MKKLIVSIMSAVMLVGCATSNIQFTDLQVTGASAAAGKGALLLIPTTQRASVKNWMFFIATKARTLSGDATPQQLNDLLVSSIPANVISQVPEITGVVIPAIVEVYQLFYRQFSTDHTRLVHILNDIATGVEAAASQN